ncbi:hypothetical protein [Azonexus hydrophilus]|uniref:hypothetical protein n=1 Tax=Azonexus hydrophilus TaxID=418702 RepID=UPI00248FF2A0|nr:hypothetical protein [Azonexus hydrophilus]
MNDPRCFKESSGDCFFGVGKALALSLFLHLLVYFGLDFPRPQQPEGSGKLSAVLGHQSKRLPQHAADTAPQARVPGRAPVPVDKLPTGRPDVRGHAQSGPAEIERGLQAIPAGEELSAYRLALGRAFGNLLDEALRSAVPPGELIFHIDYQSGLAPPSLRLSGVLDPVIAARLLAAMSGAVATTPLPAAWQSGRYQLELRARIVGA